MESITSVLETEHVSNSDEMTGIKPNFSAVVPDPHKQNEKEEIKGHDDESESSSPTIQPSLKSVSPPKPNSEVDSSLPSSEDEDSIQLKKKRDSKSSQGSSASSQKKNLPKSDSFSHNSEYDGKKRRNLNSNPQRRLASKANSYSSSSDDEDLRQKNKSASMQNNKSASMQNLARKDKNKVKEATAAVSHRKSNGDSDRVQKSSSMLRMNLNAASPEALGNDQKLMESFQAELEQQFEQWKVQFLQRHLSAESPTEAVKVITI